jgi:L-alanine-DL-glutamate epimerase-like enolase superfamily enzyme
MKVRVREVGLFLRPVRTRFPFRYGKANVVAQPYLHLRVRCEPDAVGVSAAALPPLWFDKDPSKTHEDNVRDLLASVRAAADVWRSLPAGTAFGLHRAGEPEVRRRCAGLNDLTAGFGVALLDAAVVDAVCRLSGKTFHQGLRADLFGFGALEVPPRPLDAIAVRHTVGMADPITKADVASPLADGLPETLEEVVRATGARWYKVKVSGDAKASLERLRRIAAVLDRLAGDYKVTLDGNEQFATMRDAAGFVRWVAADAALTAFWRRTAWIEQPVERGAAFDEGPGEIDRLKPVIIDESDGTDDAVDRALALGYRGISAKNCKGVFRTLHSFRRTRGSNAILSSEDLMNIPVVPLQQDLCVAAALGITHSERNGHHYIRAFDFLSPKERQDALREFPSLYRPDPPSVRVVGGLLDVREINEHAFGVRSEPDWEALAPA